MEFKEFVTLFLSPIMLATAFILFYTVPAMPFRRDLALFVGISIMISWFCCGVSTCQNVSILLFLSTTNVNPMMFDKRELSICYEHLKIYHKFELNSTLPNKVRLGGTNEANLWIGKPINTLFEMLGFIP